MFKKIFLSLLLVVFLGICGYVFKIYEDTRSLKLSPEERQAAAKNLLGHAPTTDQPVITGNQAYNGKYISFQYPKAASIYHRDPTYSPSPTELENVIFQEIHPRLFFTVTVLSRPDMQKVEDFPSVSVREKQTDQYSSQPITIGNVNGIEFTGLKASPDTRNWEKSAFFYQNGKIYSFALTGSDMDEVNSMFDQVLKTANFL
jgi:hypothetical protein